jgi:hypothetical protein
MKLRCPQCSTVVNATTDPVLCPNCGFTAPLPPNAAQSAAPPPPTPMPYSGSMSPPPGYGGQPSYNPPTMPNVYGGQRPVGKERPVALVVILTILTLGIYTLIWEWKISKEMDAFTGQPGRHKIIRTAIVLAMVGIIVILLGVVLVVKGIPEVESALPGPTFLPGFLLFFVAAGLFIAAYIMMVMGLYRIWTALEHDDKMRAEQNPTSAGLLLALMLVALVVNVVVFVVYGMTQSALNRTWKVYSTPPPPTYAAGTASF